MARDESVVEVMAQPWVASRDLTLALDMVSHFIFITGDTMG